MTPRTIFRYDFTINRRILSSSRGEEIIGLAAAPRPSRVACRNNRSPDYLHQLYPRVPVRQHSVELLPDRGLLQQYGVGIIFPARGPQVKSTGGPDHESGKRREAG